MLRFQVDGMTCGHCVSTITKALQGVDPAADVTADLGAKVVTVESKAEPEALAQAIRQAGYAVQAR